MNLHVPGMCFWPGMTRKELELSEKRTCLWPGAQVWYSHKWRKLVTASPSLHCIDGYKCFRYSTELYRAVFQILEEVFSYCILTEMFLIGFQKWFDHEWIDFLIFSFKNGFFCWPHIYYDWNLKELLNCYSFWWLRILSMFKLRGNLVCSLKLLVLLSYRTLQFDWEAIGMQCNFTFCLFVSTRLFFPGSTGKTISLLLKPN